MLPLAHERVFPEYPPVGSLVTILFCGFVLTWYLQIGFRIPFLGAVRFEFWYAALLTGLVLQNRPSLSSPLTGYLVALFSVVAVQVPFSQDFATSYNVFVDRVVKFFFMALFIASFVKGPSQLRWFLGAFLLACFKMGQEGLFGTVTGSMIWENQGVLRLRGPTPIYAHPNSFAGMAIGTLPFVFYLIPIGSRVVKLLLSGQALLALNIVLFTGSRTGYVAVLALPAILVAKSRRKCRAAALVLLLGAAVVPIIPVDYTARFMTIFTGVDKEGHSTELRAEILRDAWAVFQRYPLGVGVAAFPAVREAMFGRSQDTHNLYLEVATNLGIQGVVVFILYVTAQLRLLSRIAVVANGLIQELEETVGAYPQTSRMAVRNHLNDLRLMRQAAQAVQVFLLVRLVLGLFGMDFYEIYWWFAVGATIALHKMLQIAENRSRWLIESARV